MPRFMLMVYRDFNEENPSPSQQQMQGLYIPYKEWLAGLVIRDKIVDMPLRLDTNGRYLTKDFMDKKAAGVGPLKMGDYAIMALFDVNVENYREAVKIAQTCPIIKYGGIIEIRAAL